MLRTVSSLITACLLACFPDAALADWSKLRTPHFLFVGDASEGQIRRTAQRLEQFRDVRFEDIDFITYRSASPGTVACGPLPSPVRVLTTYRPSETAASVGPVLGDLVAVELLPDDYTPRLTPGEGGAIQR